MKPLLLLILAFLILSCGTDNNELYKINLEILPESGGSVKIQPEGLIHDEGTKIALTAIPHEGYLFKEWTRDINSTDTTYTFILSRNMNIEAYFNTDRHSVETYLVGNGTVEKRVVYSEETPNPPIYKHGSILELTASPSIGWDFLGWQIDHAYREVRNLDYESTLEIEINSSLDIWANFTLSKNRNRSKFISYNFGYNDFANSIAGTNDGGYVLTGMSNMLIDMFGGGSIYGKAFIAKYDIDDNQLWVNHFGVNERNNSGKAIIENTNGNLFVLGDFGLDARINLMKLKSNGDRIWTQSYGDSYDYGRSIIETIDGLALTGYYFSRHSDFNNTNRGRADIFVLALSDKGTMRNAVTIGGSGKDIANSITQAHDGGFVISGWSNSNDGDLEGINNGEFDIVVIKLNSNYEKEWIKVFGGSSPDYGNSIIKTSDGNYLLVGRTLSTDGDFTGMNSEEFDICVLKIDGSGNLIWQKTIGGSGADKGESVIETYDKTYMITGSSDSNDGDFKNLNRDSEDIILIELDSKGNTNNITTFGGNRGEVGNSISSTVDGSIIITGNTNSDNGDFMKDRKLYRWSDIFLIKWW